MNVKAGFLTKNLQDIQGNRLFSMSCQTNQEQMTPQLGCMTEWPINLTVYVNTRTYYDREFLESEMDMKGVF